MSNETMTDDLAGWLAREMPAGTVIGNPAWWAKRIAARLRGEAAQGDFVKIESHWLKNILSAAALLEGTGSILDKREADALRKLVKSAAPAAPAPVAGWVQAVDTELVNAHLGVANADDDFETARRKLSELIQWHIDVSHDPRVNGAPVAGDAVAVDDAMVERGAAGIWGFVPRGVPWPPEREGMADEWRGFARACLTAALAQDRASQAGVPVGVEAQVSALQSVRDRMMAALTPKFGDAFDGDFDVMLEAINTIKRFRMATLTQQPAAEDFCDGHCTWRDHAPGCPRHDAQPPAAEAPAPVAGDAAWGWQYLASNWLGEQAEEQENTNSEYPRHAAAYSEWRDRPVFLRMLADKVKKAEGSIKRHCPPPSWMFPDDPAVVADRIEVGMTQHDLSVLRAFVQHGSASLNGSDHLLTLLDSALSMGNTSKLAAFTPPAVPWIQEWSGFGPRGFYIRNKVGLSNYEPVAFLGDQIDGAEVGKIIAAHNAALAQDRASQAGA